MVPAPMILVPGSNRRIGCLEDLPGCVERWFLDRPGDQVIDLRRGFVAPTRQRFALEEGLHPPERIVVEAPDRFSSAIDGRELTPLDGCLDQAIGVTCGVHVASVGGWGERRS